MKLWRRRNEFSAHEGNVNALKLGRGTGMCLVTGGDDSKVNVWKIGHRRPSVSLSVDSVPIASVSFDASDEYAVSGNRDGCVTVWDIPHEKVGRQFSGHNGCVSAVQYHPSKGYYIISGSEDSSVKIWDVRRKSCLHSFKGNTKQVTQCSFSPDGKWICAGFADGEVKLWDIRTRKLLQCLREHRAWISGIEFHPAECLMATSSFDGSVRLWDLENSETVEKVGPERLPVRCIQFSGDGECLLSAVPDGLRSHGWEPYQLHDSVSVPWTNVQDMAICESQKKLVVCSSEQTQVGVWLIDLKRLKPFAKHEPPPAKTKREDDKKSRKDSSAVPALKMESVYEMRDSDGSARTTTSGRYSDKYLSFSTERSSVGQTVRDASTDSERCKHKPSTDRTSARSLARTPKKLDLSELQQPQQQQQQPHPSPGAHQHQIEPTPQKYPICPPLHERGAATCRTYAEKKHCLQKECERYSQKTERQTTKKDSGSYASRDIHIEAFMPKKQQPLKPELPSAEPDDMDCIDDMMCKKDMIRHILSSRVCNLQIVRRFWEQGNLQETLKAVQRCENTSVAVDFIGAICPLQKILTLDLIPYLIPVVLEMLRSSHERYWETGLNVLAISLKSFCGVIRETINGATMSMGVNISLEQRFEKCRTAQESLLETQSLVERLAKMDSSVAGQAKDVQCRLADLTT